MCTLMDQNTQITATFDQFRATAAQEISNLKAGAGTGGMSKGLTLMSAKDFKPTVFSGLRDQDYKPWRKKFITYANLQCTGFPAALEWIENRPDKTDADAIQVLAWEHSAEADPKFWDSLSMTTSDNALIIVESVAKGKGFEAWRCIHERYAPSGGRFELSKMVNVLKRTPCKSMNDLPRAIDDLEKDVNKYNDVTGFSLLPELKLPLLLECLPATHKTELELKYSMGERNYDKIVRDLLTYSKEHKFDHGPRKDPNAMDLDSLQRLARDLDNARRDYQDDIAEAQAGRGNYSEQEWIDHLAQLKPELDETIDWMGKKDGRRPNSTKGTKGGQKGGDAAAVPGGKGWNGQVRERNALIAPPLPGQKDTRTCRWCNNTGHVIKDCRAKADGKPQHPAQIALNRKPLKALDEAQEWEEQGSSEEAMSFEELFAMNDDVICGVCENEFVHDGESTCSGCKSEGLNVINLDAEEMGAMPVNEWDECDDEEDEPAAQRWRQPITSPARTAKEMLRPIMYALTPSESEASNARMVMSPFATSAGARVTPSTAPAFPLTQFPKEQRIVFELDGEPSLREKIESQTVEIRKHFETVTTSPPPGLIDADMPITTMPGHADTVSGVVWVSAADDDSPWGRGAKTTR